MPEAMKNMYNEESLCKLALDIKSVYSEFQAEEFLQSILNETWEELELKKRVARISIISTSTIINTQCFGTRL